MARELSKENLEMVFMQATMAVQNVRTQHHRLLELHRRLQRHQATPAPADVDSGPIPAPADAKLGQIASDVFKVYYFGLDAGAKMLSVCLKIAVESRAVSTINIALALMPGEQLYDAQRLPARPTTQAQALARVDSALLSVMMLGEHHLPRCVECLVGGRAPVRGKPDSRDDEPLAAAAATEGVAKVGLSDGPAASATAETGSKRRHAAGGGEVDKALDYLCRAIRMTSLAMKHIDLAVSVLSRFLNHKEVARLADLTDGFAYLELGIEISQPTTSPDQSTE